MTKYSALVETAGALRAMLVADLRRLRRAGRDGARQPGRLHAVPDEQTEHRRATVEAAAAQASPG